MIHRTNCGNRKLDGLWLHYGGEESKNLKKKAVSAAASRCPRVGPNLPRAVDTDKSLVHNLFTTSMTTYRISDTAYFKIFFHAAKHPHAAVNGVLVGKQTSNGVEIVDIVPLLHHWTSLSPMMEIGLDLVRRRGHGDERDALI